MRIEIIRPDGDLKREVWTFDVIIGWVQDGRIYLDSYHFEKRDTPRKRKWVVESHWERIEARRNLFAKPTVPADIELAVRNELAKGISSIPIV